MTHPLAKKAADRIWRDSHLELSEVAESAETIHTTAVEPILKAGGGLEEKAQAVITHHERKAPYADIVCIQCGYDDGKHNTACFVGHLKQALTEWRRVKGGE